MSMKKGMWHRNAQGKLVRRRGRRPNTVQDAVNIVLPVEKVPDDRQWQPLDRADVERILDGVWRSLSADEKVKAILNLYFDPSNPNED